jgi:hypothetical protein
MAALASELLKAARLYCNSPILRRTKGKMKRIVASLLALSAFCGPDLLAAVRGHRSMYAAGTVNTLTKDEQGVLQPSEQGLVFTPEKGESWALSYDHIAAMEYGEHAGRRVGATIATTALLGPVGLVTLFSKKKRHYLTIYFNSDVKAASAERQRLASDSRAMATGDVAVFEVNKGDYADLINVLQAKTGVKVQREVESR